MSKYEKFSREELVAIVEKQDSELCYNIFINVTKK